MYEAYLERWEVGHFQGLVGGKKSVDAIPSYHTAPIILCPCLERTNVYCYNKAAFVVIACAPCPLLLVSALLPFCAGLGGLLQPAASAAL